MIECEVVASDSIAPKLQMVVRNAIGVNGARALYRSPRRHL